MRIDTYIPALPASYTGSRGTYQYATDSMIQSAFAHQHGKIRPACLSTRYILPDDLWMHEALAKFHKFNLTVTGKQPQHLYQKGVFVCPEFAWNFKAFLNLCHVLHWNREIGEAKIAVGFGVTGPILNPDVPERHALNLTVMKKKARYYICGKEPQLAMSPESNYGIIADCSSFTEVLF